MLIGFHSQTLRGPDVRNLAEELGIPYTQALGGLFALSVDVVESKALLDDYAGAVLVSMFGADSSHADTIHEAIGDTRWFDSDNPKDAAFFCMD